MRTLLLVFAACLLAACATAPPQPAPSAEVLAATWAGQRAALLRIDGFTLKGRAAIHRGSGGGSVGVRWVQAGSAVDLWLMAPLGQGTFHLSSTKLGVALSTPDGQRHTAPDLETLMQTHLKWSLPIDGARFWVRGVPDPRVPVANLQLDAGGRLTALDQAGWQLRVQEYQPVQGLSLPKRLTLTAGEVNIRLVIDHWDLTLK